MARTYELGFIVDPRQSDDAVQELIDRYREMIEESGSTITEVDNWGRRKLAYPIQKFTEGKYVFLFITSETGSPPFAEIERLMRQNDKILRFLTVRTDEDLKRAARKGKPGTPGGPIKPPTAEEIAAEEAAAEKAAADKAAAAEKAAAEKPAETPAEAPAQDEAEAPKEDAAPADASDDAKPESETDDAKPAASGEEE